MAIQPSYMQNIFEDLKGKDKESRAMTPINVQKALQGKLSTNLMHFSPYQGIGHSY